MGGEAFGAGLDHPAKGGFVILGPTEAGLLSGGLRGHPRNLLGELFPSVREEVGRGRVGGGQSRRRLQANLSFRHAHFSFLKALVQLVPWKHRAFRVQEAQGIGLFPEEIPALDVRDVLGEFPRVFPELFNLPGGELRGSHDGTEFLGGEDFSPALTVEGAGLDLRSVGQVDGGPMGGFRRSLPGKSEVHIHPQSLLPTGFLKGFG